MARFSPVPAILHRPRATVAAGFAFVSALGAVAAVAAGGVSIMPMAQPWTTGPALELANSISFSIEPIEAEPGEEVPVVISLPGAAELARSGAGEWTFILIRNIPEAITLSLGMPAGKIWVLSLQQAGALRLISAPNATGAYRLEFNLVGPGNRVLAQQSVELLLRPQPRRDTVGVAAIPQDDVGRAGKLPNKAPRPAKSAAPLDAGEEDVLLKRGEEILSQGGIAGARLLFEELAQRGSAKGALALARSYDPAYLRASAASSVTPDIDKALMWYERAADLGNAEARRRLAELVLNR